MPAGTIRIAENYEEKAQDIVLACFFSIIAIVALVKCRRVIVLEGAEAAIKTFYFLIFGAAALRAIWFSIPSSVLEPSYAPAEVWAFRTPGWVGTLVSEILLCSGSLSLFAIFVLIIIYWADLLKKVFKPVRKHEPMTTFITIMGSLAAFEIFNFALFATGIYSSEIMTLLDSMMLALLSMICVVEISIFSHRFRTVLTTLGAINQVPTDSQVKTIVWITIFGNIFFIVRAGIEIFLAVSFFIMWKQHKPLYELSQAHYWDIYILVKHISELAILFLMLYTLQSRKTQHVHHHQHGAQHHQYHTNPGHTGGPPYPSHSGSKGEYKPNRKEYTEVKDLEAVPVNGSSSLSGGVGSNGGMMYTAGGVRGSSTATGGGQGGFSPHQHCST